MKAELDRRLKDALSSLLLGMVIFLFSFSEHLLASRLGEYVGGHSPVIHLLTIAIVILLLMPVKQRIERLIETTFKDKLVKF